MALSAQQDKHDFFQLPDFLQPSTFVVLIMTAQLLVMLFTLFEYGLHFDWAAFAKITVYVQWQAIISAMSLTLWRKKINALTDKRYAALVSYLSLLIVAAAVAVTSEWILHLDDVVKMDWELITRNFLISLIVAGVSLRYLFVQQQLIHQEKAAVLASLASLQARIKPHFLFNTMNSIASLISFAPAKAEKMVEDFCALLRESLKDERVETTIEQEWGLCERYLSIEHLRLGDRLKWEADFSALDKSLPIPSLTLQPIVENAIYHGIQPALDDGFIRVKGEFNEGEVVISIENSQFDTAQSQRANKGNKMAITNIRHRIQQLYGSTAALELIDLGKSFRTVLRYQPKSVILDID